MERGSLERDTHLTGPWGQSMCDPLQRPMKPRPSAWAASVPGQSGTLSPLPGPEPCSDRADKAGEKKDRGRDKGPSVGIAVAVKEGRKHRLGGYVKRRVTTTASTARGRGVGSSDEKRNEPTASSSPAMTWGFLQTRGTKKEHLSFSLTG